MAKSSDVALAMVALPEARIAEASRIVEALRAIWPECPPVQDVSKAKGGLVALKLEGADAFVTVVDAPLSWTELASACGTAREWPEATESMRAHAAHAMVTVIAPEKSPIVVRLLLTRLTAAVTTSSEAVGIYWSEGALVHSPRHFVDIATEANERVPPMELWVDVRVVPDEDGTHSLFTTGLASLGHKEIEVKRSKRPAEEVSGLAYSLATYLLANGPIVGNGSTFGRSSNERYKVTFTKSMHPRGGEVMRLEI